MYALNVDAVNKVSVSGVALSGLAFKVKWIMATDGRNPDTLNCRFHNHAFFELHIVISGKLSYGFDDATLSLSGGEFCIISPKCRHKVTDYSQNIGKLTVAFELDENSAFLSAFEEAEKKRFTIDDELSENISHILKLCESKNGYKAELLVLSLSSLLFGVAKSVGIENSCEQEVSDDRVLKAKKLIEDNSDILFTCSEVASYCRISEKQLGRLFEKFEKSSLFDYIHKKKTEQAKRLIEEGVMPHRKIAEALGFSSVQYYGKFFMKNAGLTPEQYRKDFEKTKDSK